MIEKIKEKIYLKYWKEEKNWIFLSAFDKSWELLFSNWVILTDEDIETSIETLYNGIIKSKEKEIKNIVIDIVDKIQEMSDPKEILAISPKEYGFLLVEYDATSKASWVILPNTEWIADAKHALSSIKKKYNLYWKVIIYTFTTTRIIL